MREQEIYARWLEIGVALAFALLAAGFAAYVLGLLEPLVPIAELVRLWSLPVDRYVAATGAPTGWGWVRVLGRGDYLNFLGISLLGTVTIVCYARIVPALPRLHAALAVIQIAVLLAAAVL